MCIKQEMSCGISKKLLPLDEMKGYDWEKEGKMREREEGVPGRYLRDAVSIQ